MATTTTVHAQLIRYTTGGDQIVINLKSTASDVLQTVRPTLKFQVR